MSIPTKLKVLVIGPVDFLENNKQYVEFCKIFEVVTVDPKTPEELSLGFENEFSDISAIFNVLHGIWAVGGPNKFIDSFPASVKVFTFPWVGHDSIDGEKLKLRGISLCNVGSVSAPHVADSALYLTLSCYKLTPIIEQTFRETGDCHEARAFIGGKHFDANGVPEKADKKKIITELTVGGKLMSSPQGHTVGIVGLGAIGKEIAKRLWAIGMNIQYTKRTPLTKEEAAKLPYESVFFENFTDMIPNCDLIVFAVPHSPTTRHFINLETIKLVKPGVRIVNIGRGSAIDEEVLLKLLDDGTVTSVGLDVFENEPKIDKRFTKRWDVSMTPHIGSSTNDNMVQSHEISMENIKNVLLEGGEGIFPVN